MNQELHLVLNSQFTDQDVRIFYTPDNQTFIVRDIDKDVPIITPLKMIIDKIRRFGDDDVFLLVSGIVYRLKKNREIVKIKVKFHIEDFEMIGHSTLALRNGDGTVHFLDYRDFKWVRDPISDIVSIPKHQSVYEGNGIIFKTTGTIYLKNINEEPMVLPDVSDIKRVCSILEIFILVTHSEKSYLLKPAETILTRGFWYSHNDLLKFPSVKLDSGYVLFHINTFDGVRDINLLTKGTFYMREFYFSYFHDGKISFSSLDGKGTFSNPDWDVTDIAVSSKHFLIKNSNDAIIYYDREENYWYRFNTELPLSFEPVKQSRTKSARS